MLLADLPVVTPDAVLHLPQNTKPGGTCWWLLWTESQREKRLAGALEECGAVPVIVTNVHIAVRKNGAGREFKERKEVILFPGYVFANGTAEQVFAARAKYRAQLVGIAQQAKTAQQLARIIEVSAAAEDLTVVKVQPGRRVEVVKGPFTGKQGIVLETRPGYVYFEMDLLGRLVEMEMPSDYVEPA